jgi:uncharacterized protein YbjQ (UPF0145 family)
MILTTSDFVEGKAIKEYLGPVGAEIVWGVNFWKDAEAQVKDVFGGRVRDYEKVYADARAGAMQGLTKEARAKGAAAVIGIRFSYQALGERNQILMVAANGTAVTFGLTEREQELQRRAAMEDEALYYVDIADARKGPFSILQLRELLLNGRIEVSQYTYEENGAQGPGVRELLSTPASPL